MYLNYIKLKINAKMGSVYLLGDREKEGKYKIGCTRGSVENRIKKLQTGNSGEIYVVESFCTEYPFLVEKMLHTVYSNKNVLNEWYELDENDVKMFEDNFKKAEKNINALKDNYFFKKKYNTNNYKKDYFYD